MNNYILNIYHLSSLHTLSIINNYPCRSSYIIYKAKKPETTQIKPPKFTTLDKHAPPPSRKGKGRYHCNIFHTHTHAYSHVYPLPLHMQAPSIHTLYIYIRVKLLLPYYAVFKVTTPSEKKTALTNLEPLVFV